NIILSLILSFYMGISGLALATAISSLINAILLLKGMKKKFPEINFNFIHYTMIRIIGVSSVSIVPVVLLYKYAISNEYFMVFIGFTLYFLITYLLMWIFKLVSSPSVIINQFRGSLIFIRYLFITLVSFILL